MQKEIEEIFIGTGLTQNQVNARSKRFQEHMDRSVERSRQFLFGRVSNTETRGVGKACARQAQADRESAFETSTCENAVGSSHPQFMQLSKVKVEQHG